MRLIISGGGTGGHIYPAFSIYERLGVSIPYCEKLYIGSRFGIEKELLKTKNIAYKEISARGFERDDKWYSFISFFYLIRSFVETFFILRKFKPDLVIGMGGFVSGPVVIMASLMGIDTMIHEQNVVPGFTTRKLSRFAKKILFSYKESIQYFSKYKNKLYYTGNPVRQEFTTANRAKAREKLGIEPGDTLVISMGGSSGAKTINDLSPYIAGLTNELEKLKYVHITGKYYEEKYKEEYDIDSFSERVIVLGYTEDMCSLMAAADLIICRSGAITLAEMAAIRLPGILIPSPNVANDHQTHNAAAFKKMGTCVMITEDELSAQKVLDLIKGFINQPERLNAMREAYKPYELENALSTIISLIYDYNIR